MAISGQAGEPVLGAADVDFQTKVAEHGGLDGERAVGGLPIRLGTVLAIQAALERLPTTPAELAKVVAAARAQHPAEEPQS